MVLLFGYGFTHSHAVNEQFRWIEDKYGDGEIYGKVLPYGRNQRDIDFKVDAMARSLGWRPGRISIERQRAL